MQHPQISWLARRSGMVRRLTITLICLNVFGCSTDRSASTSAAMRPDVDAAAHPRVQSAGLSVRLIGTVGEKDAGSLVQDPGWLEYLLAIENAGREPVMIRNVKVLTSEGRYLDSAVGYEQLATPPDAATEVATDVARRSAGIAAGQVIPYGGAVVGILSGAMDASSARSAARTRSEFALRRLKDVELAAGGRTNGSAFLPRIRNPIALVLDLERGDRPERLELPLGKRP
jgi:hypothetical protein